VKVTPPPPAPPAKKPCPAIPPKHVSLRVGKHGTTINTSDLVPQGYALKPGSQQWYVNGNPRGNGSSLIISREEWEKNKNLQFKLVVEDRDGCELTFEGSINSPFPTGLVIGAIAVVVVVAVVVVLTKKKSATTTETKTGGQQCTVDPFTGVCK
jgi:hypothetical protein